MALALHGSSEHSVSCSQPLCVSQSQGWMSIPDVQSNGTEKAQQAESKMIVRPIPIKLKRLIQARQFTTVTLV